MNKLKEAARLALDALVRLASADICDMAHHAKKHQHDRTEPCPIEVMHSQAIDALTAALALPDAPKKQGKSRKLLGYGDCRCVPSKYCDGQCNPQYEDAADAQPAIAPELVRLSDFDMADAFTTEPFTDDVFTAFQQGVRFAERHHAKRSQP